MEKQYRTVREEYQARTDVVARGRAIAHMPLNEINSLEDLHARRLWAWKESDDRQKELYHGNTGYSYPAWQLRAIEEREQQIINNK